VCFENALLPPTTAARVLRMRLFLMNINAVETTRKVRRKPPRDFKSSPMRTFMPLEGSVLAAKAI